MSNYFCKEMDEERFETSAFTKFFSFFSARQNFVKVIIPCPPQGQKLETCKWRGQVSGFPWVVGETMELRPIF